MSESLKQAWQARAAAETTIAVGVGTCGLAAGAQDVYQAIQEEVARLQLPFAVTSTACIGWCSQEPLVDVRLRTTAGLARPLAHNTELSFHTGSAEVLGKARLLEGREVAAGRSPSA